MSSISSSAPRSVDARGPADPKLFTYLRYNAELTSEWLGSHGLGNIHPHDVQRLDSTSHMDELQEVGRKVAQQVRLEHFEGFLPPRVTCGPLQRTRRPRKTSGSGVRPEGLPPPALRIAFSSGGRTALDLSRRDALRSRSRRVLA